MPTPIIQVNTGFDVDENHALTGMTIGSHITTLTCPTIFTFNGTTIMGVSMFASGMTAFSAQNATTINASSFSGCTALQTVNLGSAGHPVSTIGSNAFTGCTQGGLTITIYTTDGASLARQPWGATNATIVYEEA